MSNKTNTAPPENVALADKESDFRELSKMIVDMMDFCRKRKVPIFIAVEPDSLIEDGGNIVESLTPIELNTTVKNDIVTKLALSGNSHLRLVLAKNAPCDQFDTDIVGGIEKLESEL